MIFIKLITLENGEVILINGKIYVVAKNVLADDDSYSLECIEPVISKDLKKEILCKESNGRTINIATFNMKYANKLKD